MTKKEKFFLILWTVAFIVAFITKSRVAIMLVPILGVAIVVFLIFSTGAAIFDKSRNRRG